MSAGAGFVVSGQTLNSFIDAFNNNVGPVSDVYYCLPSADDLSGNPPYSTNRNYQETKIWIPGVPGVATKRRYPFGIKGIYADLLFIGTKAQAETLRENFMTLCEALNRYTITMPDGQIFNGCKLESAKKVLQTQINGSVCEKCAFTWTQWSTDN